MLWRPKASRLAGRWPVCHSVRCVDTVVHVRTADEAASPRRGELPVFDFIRKPLMWQLWDKGLHKELEPHKNFHLKSIQDLADQLLLSKRSTSEVVLNHC